MIDIRTFAFAAKLLVSSLCVAVMLIGCGGGTTNEQTSTSSNARALAVLVTPPSQASIVRITKISETRISRTVYDYVFKVTIQGGSISAENVVARLLLVGNGTTIVDGEVRAGAVGSGAIVEAVDTITLRHDRTFTFDTAALVWQFDTNFRTVGIESSVPAATSNQLSIITSSSGEFAVGSPVEMPTLNNGEEDLILASNAAGNVFLASLVPAGTSNLTLGVTSTALALTRMMIGPLPPNITIEQVNIDIQNTLEFSNLVSLINSALSAGLTPIDFPGVADSIGLVLFQASNQTSRVFKQSIASTKVTTPLPYEVLSNGLLDSYSIYVTGSNAAVNGVNLRNGITIHYAAYGALSDGTVIPTGGAESPDHIPQIDLPPHNPLFDVLGGSSLDKEVGIPGNGKIWNLTVLQTPVTRTANGIEISQDILKVAVAFGSLRGLSLSCVPSIVTGVLGSSPVAPWASQQSVSAGVAAFRESLSSNRTWADVAKIALKCTLATYNTLTPDQKAKADKLIARLQGSNLAKQLAPKLNKLEDSVTKIASNFSVGKILRGRKIANLTYDVLNTSIKLSFFYNHWNEEAKIGVCQATNPATNQLEVANCPATLYLSPPVKSMLVGDNFSLTVVAKDSNGNPTLAPSGLQFKSSDPSSVSVDAHGVITALKQNVAPTTITATEPILGVTGTMTVDVKAVSATIEVAPTSIALGGSATLSWSSINSSACTGTGAWSGPVGIAGTRSVVPTATGTFNYGISCNGPGGPAIASAILTVVDGPREVTAWIKYAYDYIDLSFATANEVTFKSSPGIYMSNNYKISRYPAVKDNQFICDAIGNAFISPGDCWVRLTYHYSSTPSGPSPFVYWADPNGSYITSYDVTLHRRRVVDVVSASGFTPSPTSGGNNSITVIVHSSWCPACPLMPPGPEGVYGSLLALSEPAFIWVRGTALITDVDGNGYDDNGEHDVGPRSTLSSTRSMRQMMRASQTNPFETVRPTH